MSELFEFVLGLLNIVTLIIVALINRDNKRNKEKEEARYNRRLEYERLSMELTQKDCKLTILTAKKIAGEHINGDYEAAIKDAEEAYDGFRNFMQAQMASSIAKG